VNKVVHKVCNSLAEPRRGAAGIHQVFRSLTDRHLVWQTPPTGPSRHHYV